MPFTSIPLVTTVALLGLLAEARAQPRDTLRIAQLQYDAATSRLVLQYDRVRLRFIGRAIPSRLQPNWIVSAPALLVEGISYRAIDAECGSPSCWPGQDPMSFPYGGEIELDRWASRTRGVVIPAVILGGIGAVLGSAAGELTCFMQVGCDPGSKPLGLALLLGTGGALVGAVAGALLTSGSRWRFVTTIRIRSS